MKGSGQQLVTQLNFASD